MARGQLRLRLASRGAAVRRSASKAKCSTNKLPFDAVGWSAGGLLYAYEVGVAHGLGLHTRSAQHVQHAGASAGALTAASIKAGVAPSDCLRAMKAMCSNLRKHGTAGRLRIELEGVLMDMLPADCHVMTHGQVHVALTRVHASNGRVSLQPELASEFYDKHDMVQGLLASCHIPLYFHRFTLTTSYRGMRYLDGGLLNFLPSVPQAFDCVRVNCFPLMQRLQTLKDSEEQGGGAEYDLRGAEEPSKLSLKTESASDTYMNSTRIKDPVNGDGTPPVDALPVSKEQLSSSRANFQQRYQLRRQQQPSWLSADIAPDMRTTESVSAPGSNFSVAEALRLALLPPDDDVLDQLYERGEADAKFFLEQRRRQEQQSTEHVADAHR